MNKRTYAAALALAVAACPIAAMATGTTRVQHSDGTVNVYQPVGIKIIPDKALVITSPDGTGRIIIYRAACSYVGELMRCFPTGITWKQNGESHPLDLQRGTIYLNQTASSQPLPLSSTQVPANSIVMSLQTKRGTYINVTGTIDGKAAS